MTTPAKKRSRPPSREAAGAIAYGSGHSELVQTHVSKQAKQLIRERAQAEAISESAVVRRLLYVGLGIMKDDKAHG